MSSLLKIMLTLAAVFASTFILLKSTGAISVEKIELWLTTAKQVSPIYVAALVAGLLFADLFIAVPTLTVTLLAGYLLGAAAGSAAAIVGLSMAGFCGYALSARYGDKLLTFLVKDPQSRADAINTFQRHGAIVILLARAVPILPEVSACMAGLSRMRFGRFALLWLGSTIPYVSIAAYAGSISSLENPKPAILAAIGLTGFLWISWALFNRINKHKRA